MIDLVRVRFAVETIGRALQADGAELRLLDFDPAAGRVRVAANLDFDCKDCVMTSDQLQSLIRDTVEQQLGRPVSVEVTEA